MPDQIQFTEGHKNLYTYDASGKKLEAVNYTVNNIVNVPIGTISTLPASSSDYTKLTTDYVGNMIYENGSLKEILLPDGYWQNGVYYYYLKDHLGNNRVVINNSGAVVENSHYYPSGMRFYPESTSNSAALPYRYNGKELEAMNGLNEYDYGARRRGTGLPVWTSVDPLAEKYYSISPYAYCGGNPVRYVDPNGMDYKYDWNTGEYKNGSGNVVSFNDVKANNFIEPTENKANSNGDSKNALQGSEGNAIVGSKDKPIELGEVVTKPLPKSDPNSNFGADGSYNLYTPNQTKAATNFMLGIGVAILSGGTGSAAVLGEGTVAVGTRFIQGTVGIALENPQATQYVAGGITGLVLSKIIPMEMQDLPSFATGLPAFDFANQATQIGLTFKEWYQRDVAPYLNQSPQK